MFWKNRIGNVLNCTNFQKNSQKETQDICFLGLFTDVTAYFFTIINQFPAKLVTSSRAVIKLYLKLVLLYVSII